ncbi:uncharacterized protein LOC125662519 isoform X2 [Ostrea edulis]|uniref:uncharacterized protein LOC125662519 isoform X2 n=1 Tax=Ostrea edulis TaxID=37623 RepID=UPI0020943D22|nr:uncharacterized protein LOC125662519 isoform X2 [Ostrea edulis]
MTNTVIVVRTVVLMLAASELCWTRFIALNEDTNGLRPQTEELTNSFQQMKLPTASQNLLLLHILMNQKQFLDRIQHSKIPEKRQRRCYWSPVTCYG